MASHYETVADGCGFPTEFGEPKFCLGTDFRKGVSVDSRFDREHQIVAADDKAASDDDKPGIEDVDEAGNCPPEYLSHDPYAFDCKHVLFLHCVKNVIKADVTIRLQNFVERSLTA